MGVELSGARRIAAALLAGGVCAATTGTGCNSIFGFEHGELSQGGLPCDSPNGSPSPACESSQLCTFKTCEPMCQLDSSCPVGFRCLRLGNGQRVCVDATKSCDDGCPQNVACDNLDNKCRQTCDPQLTGERSPCTADQICQNAFCVGTDPKRDPVGSTGDGGHLTDGSPPPADSSGDGGACSYSLSLAPGDMAIGDLTLASVPGPPSCFEMWEMVPLNAGDQIFISSGNSQTDYFFALACHANGVSFSSLGTGPHEALFATKCDDGAWHHIAGCISTGGAGQVALNVYVDGHAGAQTAPFPPDGLGTKGTVVLGGVGATRPGMRATIDEVRITNLLRYISSFSPVPKVRLQADSPTVALYHFDQPSPPASDSSPNHHGGLLEGTFQFVADTSFCP